jgi:hypothetical protein
MKKFLWLAIVSPIVAYVPLFSGGILPQEINVVILPLFLLIGIAAGLYLLIKSVVTRRQRTVMLALAAAVYAIEILGIIDLAFLFSGARPVIIQSSGEGFADLATLATWILVIIPFTYIASTILVVTAYLLQRRRTSKP